MVPCGAREFGERELKCQYFIGILVSRSMSTLLVVYVGALWCQWSHESKSLGFQRFSNIALSNSVHD